MYILWLHPVGVATCEVFLRLRLLLLYRSLIYCPEDTSPLLEVQDGRYRRYFLRTHCTPKALIDTE